MGLFVLPLKSKYYRSLSKNCPGLTKKEHENGFLYVKKNFFKKILIIEDNCLKYFQSSL